MAFGDPSSPFFSIVPPEGGTMTCLLRLPEEGACRFEVLSDADEPRLGTWFPQARSLRLDGADWHVVVDDSVPVARCVAVDPETGVATLCPDCDAPIGAVVLYPGWFDRVPVGRSLADLRDMDDGPEPDEPDDEIDWADHHVAETRALARAHAAF